MNCSNSTLTVNNCHFEGNEGKYGGAIYVELFTNLEITDSTFINNKAYFNGGAIYAEDSCVSVKQTSHNVSATFSGNFARQDGGAIYLNSMTDNVLFSGTVILFEDNCSGHRGGGICSVLSDFAFNSTILFHGNIANCGGALWSSNGKIVLSRHTFFKNNSAHDEGGALYGSKTDIQFDKNVTFSYNSAIKGGAMYLEDQTVLQFTSSMNLNTSYNTASEYGGAIYHEDEEIQYQCQDHAKLPEHECFIQLLLTSGNDEEEFYLNITSLTMAIKLFAYNNSAGIDGSFLYGGLLDRCHMSISVDEYIILGIDGDYSLLKPSIYIVQPNNSINTISSKPYKLLFHSNNSDRFEIRVYRGENFNVSVYAVAQEGSRVPTTVTARPSNTARFKSNQRFQNLSQNNSILEYNLYSTEDKEKLTLHPDGYCSDEGKITVYVIFEDCPIGFSKSDDKCICEQRLMKYTTTCENIYIMRNSGSRFWVNASYQNGTYQGLILYKTCPVDYCKTETFNITLDNPDIQCALNRSEVLCGACITNHSLMLGSSRCHICPNTYLALLLPFAAAGIALVVFLSILRLTVATGMINSVILYANIVQVNRHLFFPNTANVLTVFIAWMNLDLGFETCFYNGMTTYAQTLLQFAFPIYIWILITLIIIISRYSVRVSKLIGHNPIAVLATLLLMSYTKILKIIIDVYSSAKLEYPDNKTVTVWLKDGNLFYLQSRHLLLTVMTSLVLVFLFLPYTLLLLLGYKLYRFSGRKHMRWLNRLKPLLDSYYAPYKTHTRCWTGFLLLVRWALYIVFTFGDANKNLFAIIIAFFVIVLVFTLIPGRIYTDSRINIIESLVFSNLIILSAITYTVPHEQLKSLAYSLVGMVLVTLIGIIMYHLYIHHVSESLRLKILSSKILVGILHRLKKSNLKKHENPNRAPSVNSPQKVSTSVLELCEPLLDN